MAAQVRRSERYFSKERAGAAPPPDVCTTPPAWGRAERLGLSWKWDELGRAARVYWPRKSPGPGEADTRHMVGRRRLAGASGPGARAG